MAKTGQDQRFKLNPQSHILFLIFFEKKYSKPPRQTLQDLQGIRFFFYSSPLSFQNLGLNVVPPAERRGGADTVRGKNEKMTNLKCSRMRCIT